MSSASGAGVHSTVGVVIESIEQSEDGLEIAFKLKEGVQWHNGYGEVTTEDVKFSYERMIDPVVPDFLEFHSSRLRNRVRRFTQLRYRF